MLILFSKAPKIERADLEICTDASRRIDATQFIRFVICQFLLPVMLSRKKTSSTTDSYSFHTAGTL
eukprot:m.447727 g.447727  ORF g.447727 m.447727 type:complete len:66 (+) comp21502_c0_seq3:2256-2453(+)